MYAYPYVMRESRREHYLAPVTGTDTETALDAAIERLGELRCLPPPRDASARLHLLASLIAETGRRLPHAVADARAEQCSWAQIGDLVGVTRASAQQRYGTGRAAPDPH
jgi:hypothetical protein